MYYFWLCWVFVPVQAFSNCGEWRLLFIAVHRLFIAEASLVVEQGSRCIGIVVVALRLSCPMA